MAVVLEVYIMSKEQNKGKRVKKVRQEWNPNWLVKLLYAAWTAAWSVVKIAIGAAATVLMIVVVCGVVFVGILGDYLQDDILAQAKDYELSITDLDQTSFVYAVDSEGNIQLLQRLHTDVDREWASLEEIPADLVNATIAIEDKRFYEHQGVAWITTMKACVNMFMGGSSTFGGSTITQQLIKNVTEEDSVTVQRKVMEIFKAIYSEQEHDKDTIMEWYLNTIYLGHGCFGVKSAAAEYFGKELQSLTTAECAALISITNNPSLYDPYSTREYEFRDHGMTNGAMRNKIRQENTLTQMYEQGMLSEALYEEAMAQELVFKRGIEEMDRWNTCSNVDCGYEGTLGTFSASGANYYCPVCGTLCEVGTDASQLVYSWFVDTVIEDVCADLAAMDGVDWNSLTEDGQKVYRNRIQRGGYHIYTTIDLDVQAEVDKIYEDLSQIPKTSGTQQLQSGIVIIDNSTGDIVAMSGGVGEKVEHDEYNRAAQAKLQTGSSMKPLTVYAPAFELGVISPATVITDLPITYSGGHWPKNDNRRYNYARTIYQGVTSSVNAVAVHTLDKIGFDYSLSFAKNNLGITSLTERYVTPSGNELTDLGYAPLAMGALTLGITVREMSQAYATFANNGVFREARTYTKVYDSAGNLVMNNIQTTYQAMSEKTVNYMNLCLANAANNGTGTAAVFSGQNIYGKTGTTANNRDRWFCGFTGHYTAAVWTGYDQPETISVSTNPACTLWKKVMRPIHAGLEKISLYSTSGMKKITVCLDSGLRATDACEEDVRGSRTASAYCYSQDVPSGYCDQHVMVKYCEMGEGVCTEYCELFAEFDEEVKIRQVALLQLTKKDVEKINDAKGVGLVAMYYQDNYVYLVDKDGDPIDWHGFNGKANKDVEAPYIVCTIHTKEAYEAYLEEKEKEEQEKEEQEKEEQEGTDPTEPGDPTGPSDPVDPTDPIETLPPPETTPPVEPTDPTESA